MWEEVTVRRPSNRGPEPRSEPWSLVSCPHTEREKAPPVHPQARLPYSCYYEALAFSEGLQWKGGERNTPMDTDTPKQ